MAVVPVMPEVLGRLVQDVFLGTRRLRELTDDELDACEPEFAAGAARRLHAVSYAARLVARRFDRRAPRVESPHHPPCPCTVCVRSRPIEEEQPE